MFKLFKKFSIDKHPIRRYDDVVIELAKKLSENRSKSGIGKGNKYWISQAQVAVDYMKELKYIK